MQELDDPAGNSFVENKLAPSEDPHLTVVKYTRSVEQNQMLGLTTQTEVSNEVCSRYINMGVVKCFCLWACMQSEEGAEDAPSGDEVLTFQMNCPQCQSPTETRMKTLGEEYHGFLT